MIRGVLFDLVISAGHFVQSPCGSLAVAGAGP